MSVDRTEDKAKDWAPWYSNIRKLGRREGSKVSREGDWEWVAGGKQRQCGILEINGVINCFKCC